jgi:hypothetical protein
MTNYFKSAEFWQCSVFLAWSVFELLLSALHLQSLSHKALLLGWLFFLTGSAFLIKAFTSVVRWRLANRGASERVIARVFIYTAGTLAVVLQTFWYILASK